MVRRTLLRLFILGRPLGHLNHSSQICFSDFKTDFKIEQVSEDLFREMIHSKEYIESFRGSKFKAGGGSNTQYGSSFFSMFHDITNNYFWFSILIRNAITNVSRMMFSVQFHRRLVIIFSYGSLPFAWIRFVLQCVFFVVLHEWKSKATSTNELQVVRVSKLVFMPSTAYTRFTVSY